MQQTPSGCQTGKFSNAKSRRKQQPKPLSRNSTRFTMPSLLRAHNVRCKKTLCNIGIK
jgi:hypothetical protein